MLLTLRFEPSRFFLNFSFEKEPARPITFILHLYDRSFRLVSSLQQLILYVLHLYCRSFRLLSSLQSANSLFIAFILQFL